MYARDLDTSVNGMIQYAIRVLNDPLKQLLVLVIFIELQPNNTFAIDPLTGVITVMQSLDFDLGTRKYDITVMAQVYPTTIIMA